MDGWENSWNCLFCFRLKFLFRFSFRRYGSFQCEGGFFRFRPSKHWNWPEFGCSVRNFSKIMKEYRKFFAGSRKWPGTGTLGLFRRKCRSIPKSNLMETQKISRILRERFRFAIRDIFTPKARPRKQISEFFPFSGYISSSSSIFSLPRLLHVT